MAAVTSCGNALLCEQNGPVFFLANNKRFDETFKNKIQRCEDLTVTFLLVIIVKQMKYTIFYILYYYSL